MNKSDLVYTSISIFLCIADFTTITVMAVWVGSGRFVRDSSVLHSRKDFSAIYLHSSFRAFYVLHGVCKYVCLRMPASHTTVHFGRSEVKLHRQPPFIYVKGTLHFGNSVYAKLISCLKILPRYYFSIKKTKPHFRTNIFSFLSNTNFILVSRNRQTCLLWFSWVVLELFSPWYYELCVFHR